MRSLVKFSFPCFPVFCLNNLLSTSSNPLVERHTIKKLNLFCCWVGTISLLCRFVQSKWNDMCKQIRDWWKRVFARAKRTHVLRELIHTKFPKYSCSTDFTKYIFEMLCIPCFHAFAMLYCYSHVNKAPCCCITTTWMNPFTGFHDNVSMQLRMFLPLLIFSTWNLSSCQ